MGLSQPAIMKSGVPNNSQVVVAGQARLANGVEVEVEK